MRWGLPPRLSLRNERDRRATGGDDTPTGVEAATAVEAAGAVTVGAPASVEQGEIPSRVHLVGIGGAHMSAIAGLLLARGVRVSGSDQRETDVTRRLAARGAAVYAGHTARNVGDAALVVMTAAAKEDNPEVVEARRRGIPVISRAAMVARLMEGRTGVAVAGTHGKTTTSTLIAWLLHEAGLAPAYLLGGDSIDLGGNAAPGSGAHVVVEADEYARAFLEYRPRLAVVTNIEADHLEYYGSMEALVDAFRGFMHRVPPEGTIIACSDSPELVRVLDEGLPAHVQRYCVVDAGAAGGRRADVARADWTGIDEGPNSLGGHDFTVLRLGQRYGRFSIRLPGLHNVSNATAAIAAGATLGLKADAMRAALRAFRGARRRFELLGEPRGVAIVDDYAVHPTEIAVTIASARERYPGHRIIALFQPHTYSRTSFLLDGFRGCFTNADAVYILETYAARETAEAGMSARDLTSAITTPPARYLASHKEAVAALKRDLHSGDVLLCLGAGNVNEVGQALVRELR
jgi:UDP-N-acetylmuramate--alanine ligase